MHKTPFRAVAPFVLLLATSAFVSQSFAGQGQAERRPAQNTPVPAPPPREPVGRDMDAQERRNEFMEVLRKHPPAVGRVLKLDPSLMRNESYLAAYPTLAGFLGRHQEVPLNAAYYLENVHGPDSDWEGRPPRLRMIEGLLGGMAAFTAFLIVLSTLIWLIKTVLEQRRWNRLSRIQAEVHSKLMDRFSSNDELITYVQTPSGRRFLESGPSPLQEAAPGRAMAAPFARILWSVQIGVVMLVAGVGLLFVSTRSIEEVKEFFFIGGSLVTALGAGFTVSAAASYVLSRRLGLFDPPATNHA